MTKSEVAKKLQAAGIPADSYTLYSKPRDETLTIEFLDDHWIVYYYERGLRTGVREFSNCTDAEDYFLKEITKWF